jgi:hypothetical protein
VIVFVLLTIISGAKNSREDGSWKRVDTPKNTRKYIKEKIRLANKYCSDLPAFDSRGVYGGVSGSFTDKTGKFDPSYRKEMEELNETFGIRTNDVK